MCIKIIGYTAGFVTRFIFYRTSNVPENCGGFCEGNVDEGLRKHQSHKSLETKVFFSIGKPMEPMENSIGYLGFIKVPSVFFSIGGTFPSWFLPSAIKFHRFFP